VVKRPTLYAPRGEGGRHATWLELFFDLVFVLAIAELAHYLHDHLTVSGFFGFLFLFVPVWGTWMGYTYYADLFDVDGPAYRVTMLAAMLVSIALAVSIPGALDGGSAGFAAAYVALRMLLVGLYAWAWRHAREVRPQCARYVVGFSAGALVWGASLLVPEPARYGVWLLGIIVVEIATPFFVQLTVLEELPFQVSHLPERLGLFTIIVLGESIVVTGLGVADTEWAVGSVVVAGLGFAAVGSLWWLYFDRVDESAVERAYTGGVRELLIGFGWAYGHLFVYAGLGATAVGIELAIGEATDAALGGGTRAALCGGVALYLLAITIVHPLSPPPLPKSVLTARLVVAAFALALALAGSALSPPVLVGLLALALAGLTAFEVAHGGHLGRVSGATILGRRAGKGS
jgi:low temperature requirement protein LtrA